MKGGNVKEYYKVIKEKIAPFEGMVYYEGESEARIAQLEQKWGIKIRPIFREFLLHFGFTQDLVSELHIMTADFMGDDVDLLRTLKVDGFLPIMTEVDEDYNTFIIAIKNDDTEDDTIYHIIYDEMTEKLKQNKKTKQTFTGLIDKAIEELRVGERSDNTDKIVYTDFAIHTFNLPDIIEAFKSANIKQVTKWQHPADPMADETAEFELFESNKIAFERDNLSKKYTIEVRESASVVKEKTSVSKKLEKLLKVSDLKFEVSKDIIDV